MNITDEKENDLLIESIDKYKLDKSNKALNSQLNEFFDLFPMEEKELFTELLEMVDEKKKSNFLSFARKHDILNNPMLQTMLFQMLAPYKQINSALKAVVQSGEMYEEMVANIADKFFDDFDAAINKHILDLKVFYDDINIATNKALDVINQFNERLDKTYVDLPKLCNSLSDSLSNKTNSHIDSLDKKHRDIESKLDKKFKEQEIIINNKTSENQILFLSNIKKSVNETFLKTLQDWTSWIGGAFLFGIVFTAMFSCLFLIKFFHLL